MFIVLDICFTSIALYLFVTQMVLPTIRGTKWFPMFKKEAKLASELVDVNQKVVEKDLAVDIETLKKRKGV
jgi:hypothetical protein